jgi:enoyl-CoA hydratase
MTAMHDLRYKIADQVAYVTFNRPAARNALTFAMYERLAEICQEIEADRDVKAMVLSGAGELAFTSGTEISEFTSVASPQDALDYAARVDRVIGAVERCRVPTIAAIAGACTDSGVSLAAACDLRVAAPNARFGICIARTLGICMSLANHARLAALIGPARVKDMILRARMVEAPEALSMGLVTELTIDAGGLMPRAESIAHVLAAHAPLTVRATKEALRRIGSNHVVAGAQDLLLMCYMSHDFREGVDAFLGKRAPVWRGE